VTTGAARSGAGAIATLAALALAWGCNWSFMKLVFAEFPVWGFRGFSGVIAGAAVLGVAALQTGRVVPDGVAAWRWLAIAGILNVTIWQVTTAYGVQLLGSGHAAVLAFTMPLWSGLIGWAALGERISLRFALALAMAMAGVALLSFRGGGFAADDLPGIAFMFAAAIGWALGTLYAKRGRPALPMLATTGWQLVLGSLPIVAIWPLMAVPTTSGVAVVGSPSTPEALTATTPPSRIRGIRSASDSVLPGAISPIRTTSGERCSSSAVSVCPAWASAPPTEQLHHATSRPSPRSRVVAATRASRLPPWPLTNTTLFAQSQAERPYSTRSVVSAAVPIEMVPAKS
jgi:drug/metabolite transporter (DMT)-like permease